MKTILTSFRAMLVFSLLTGVLYPLSVSLGGRLLFPEKTGGSLVRVDGKVIGSALIAQSFTQPKYFLPRPSAVKYDAASSGASNTGVSSAVLAKAVQERVSQGAVAEMRYASGSGLDPHISPTAARSQVARIARERNLSFEGTNELARLLESKVEDRQWGVFGEPRVNVLLLNLALDERFVK